MIKVPAHSRCIHIKEDGEQCGSIKALGSDKCIFHSDSPEAKKVLAEGRKKGRVVHASNANVPVLYNHDIPFLRTPNDLKKFINSQLKKVLQNQITPDQWSFSLQAAGALAKIIEIADVSNAIFEIEDRMQQMEGRLNIGKGSQEQTNDGEMTDEPSES